MKARPRLRLRTVLIGINLVVLLLPLAGIQLLRLYESALVRQTESALIAQAAFIAAFYRSLLLEEARHTWRASSHEIAAIDRTWVEGQWLPYPPVLDLADSPRLPPFPDGIQGEPAYPLSQVVGKRLMPVLKDAQLVTLAGIRVVDPQGVIVASTGEDTGRTITAGEEIGLALQGRHASRLRGKEDPYQESPLDSISRTSRIRVFVASPIMLGDRLVGAVMLSRTPPSIVQALYGKRWLLLQALVLLLTLVVVVSLLTSRLILRPIGRLAERAEHVASGETSIFGDTLNDAPGNMRTLEIDRLQDAITAMAEALNSRAQYLRIFSQHLSHELKTPITAIQGAIEVLQDHGDEMLPEQRTRFLDNVAADADRILLLTQRLMDLARAEVRASRPEPFKIATAINSAVAAFEGRGVVHTSEISEDLSEGFGNQSVFQGVIEILLENAQQHGASRVHIVVREHVTRHQGDDDGKNDADISITVTDDGCGISAGNRSRVFEPFFTTERESGGTGLGLTIARTLIQQMDGKLDLLNSESGVTFEVRLKRSV